MSRTWLRTGLCTVFLLSVFGVAQIGYASAILPGFDLFSTPAEGAYHIQGATLVYLEGDPIDPPNLGNTDTIVERLDGIDPFEHPDGEATIDIELVALSLKSIQPVTLDLGDGFGPSLYDLHVDLDPNATPPIVGSMTVSHEDPNGGTFYTTSLPVNVIITFTDVANSAQYVQQAASDTVQSNGAPPWSHTKPA